MCPWSAAPLRTLLLAALVPAGGLVAQPEPTGTAVAELQTFKNWNRTFQIDLPADWRQIAPNEAVRLRDNPSTPPEMRLSQPRRFYAVGPVDRWLAGDLSGPWLYVVEQSDAWHVGDDYAEVLRESWRAQSEIAETKHEVTDIHREEIGTQRVDCIVATRTSTPPAPVPTRRSLDIYAPSGNQQVTLAFSCAPDEYERWQPEFRRWIESLTFARPPREQATLSDRLWTPILVGAAVGIILLVLYKYTHRLPTPPVDSLR